MPVLAVAARRPPDFCPAITFEVADHVTDLHRPAGRSDRALRSPRTPPIVGARGPEKGWVVWSPRAAPPRSRRTGRIGVGIVYPGSQPRPSALFQPAPRLDPSGLSAPVAPKCVAPTLLAGIVPDAVSVLDVETPLDPTFLAVGGDATATGWLWWTPSAQGQDRRWRDDRSWLSSLPQRERGSRFRILGSHQASSRAGAHPAHRSGDRANGMVAPSRLIRIPASASQSVSETRCAGRRWRPG